MEVMEDTVVTTEEVMEDMEVTKISDNIDVPIQEIGLKYDNCENFQVTMETGTDITATVVIRILI